MKKVRSGDAKEIYKLTKYLKSKHKEVEVLHDLYNKGMKGIESLTSSQAESVSKQEMGPKEKRIMIWGEGTSSEGSLEYHVPRKGKGGMYLSDDGSFIFDENRIVFPDDGNKIQKREFTDGSATWEQVPKNK